MSNDPEGDSPTVPIVCPDCETTTGVPLTEVEARLTDHNEQLHGGEPVAEVDPEVRRHLTDLLADELLEDGG